LINLKQIALEKGVCGDAVTEGGGDENWQLRLILVIENWSLSGKDQNWAEELIGASNFKTAVSFAHEKSLTTLKFDI
jgi:hypothetical protein